jgi:hypothetical protein
MVSVGRWVPSTASSTASKPPQSQCKNIVHSSDTIICNEAPNIMIQVIRVQLFSMRPQDDMRSPEQQHIAWKCRYRDGACSLPGNKLVPCEPFTFALTRRLDWQLVCPLPVASSSDTVSQSCALGADYEVTADIKTTRGATSRQGVRRNVSRRNFYVDGLVFPTTFYNNPDLCIAQTSITASLR